MNSIKIKICGLKYAENIQEITTLKPDYLGFIFWNSSIRKLDLTKMPLINENIKKTGVFVNPSHQDVLKAINKYKLQAIQLHGSESEIFCSQLKTANVEIIKAFSIDNAFDFNQLKKYEPAVDFFLFDTKGKLPGGNGTTFDWRILNQYTINKPYFLSGGIGLNEIENIKKFLQSKASKQCYAVDLNSKFELEPGLKNKNDLEKFIKLLYEDKI